MTSCPRKLTRVVAILVLIVLSATILWFQIIPRKLFSLGMSVSEIEKSIGGHCEVTPLGTALSAPPTEFELANTPRYQVRVQMMAVNIFLNSDKKAVFIKFLFGAKGKLTVTVPSSDR